MINLSKNYAFNQTYKIILIGDSGVGKTSLTLSLRSTFTRILTTPTEPTLGASFMTYQPKLYPGIMYQIWDTAGQERYKSLVPIYLRGADVVIFVYDVTARSTFNNLIEWFNYVISKFDNSEKEKLSKEKIVFYIFANKIDLQSPDEFHRKSIVKSLENLTQNLSVVRFFETSKDYPDHLERIFEDLSSDLIKKNNKEINRFNIAPIPEEKKCCTF